MTEIADRYRRLSGAFADRIDTVRADQWDLTTPSCPEWTVRDLVGHVVATQAMFEGFVGREIGDVPDVTADPLGAWNASRAVVQRDLDDPATAQAEFEGMLGTQSFERAVDRFLNTDLILHGWDLAHATGQDETIADADLDHVRSMMEGLADKMRAPGAFGDEVIPAEDAGEQTKLLNYFGRRR